MAPLRNWSLGHKMCGICLLAGFVAMGVAMAGGGPQLPALARSVLIAVMALSGVGMVVGLYVDVFALLSEGMEQRPHTPNDAARTL